MKGKQKMRRLKNSALNGLKQMKSRRISLTVKMYLLLSLFALTLGGINILNMVLASRYMYSENFGTQLQYLTRGAMGDIAVGATPLKNYLDNLPAAHPAEVEQLREGNTSPLAIIVNETATAGSYYGYFIATPDGTITDCTGGFDGLAPGMSISKVMDQMSDGKLKGLAQVCEFGYCYVVVNTIYQEDEVTPAGIVGVILSNISHDEFIDGLKARYKIDVALIHDGKFVANTMKDAEGKPLINFKVENKSAIDSVFHLDAQCRFKEEINGVRYTSIYTPLHDKNGTPVCAFYTGIELSRSEGLTLWIGIIMFVGGLIFSLVVIGVTFLHVRKHITKPLHILSEAAKKVAENDLTSEVPLYTSGDEIETLAACVHDMKENLRDTIEEIQEAAQSLKSQSQEISRASMAISDVANNQASDIEEIASSVEEMTSIIHQTTDNSQKTDKMMVESDEAICHIAEMSTKSMEASKKIAAAIRDINALVSQTNILSLNASVEAARAGEQGKGFAVVAREVGRLAEQTRLTAVTVSETAEATIDAAMKVDSKLDEVTPQLRKVVELMKEITVSSMEQGQGAEHINSAIADLNQATQRNAAGAEELAASAEELASSADRLNTIVSAFNV